MPFPHRTYRESDGNLIRGSATLAFINNAGYALTTIDVYADGMVDCWGLVDFATFQQKVRSGWVVTAPPEGAHIVVFPLGDFDAVKSNYDVDPEDFIREVTDEIERLNGRPTTSIRCREAYEAFRSEPSDETRERLRSAYEAVPRHIRRYVLGSMDVKDRPIRSALGL